PYVPHRPPPSFPTRRSSDLDFTSTCASAARTAARTAANSKPVRALWATGKGRFRTKGRFASASIRGTSWETIDRCDGTLTVVRQDRKSTRLNSSHDQISYAV